MEQTIYKLETYVLNSNDRENIVAKMEALGNTCFHQSTINYLRFTDFNKIFVKYINESEIDESVGEGVVFSRDEHAQLIKVYIHDFDQKGKDFESLWEEMNDYEMEDELEAFTVLLQVMKDFGFNYSLRDFTVLNIRGWMKSIRLNRCSIREEFDLEDLKYNMERCFEQIKHISL